MLDTGKVNNLVNYRENKSSELEALLPDAESLFDSLEQNRTFIVFDPFILEKDKERFICIDNKQDFLDAYSGFI